MMISVFDGTNSRKLGPLTPVLRKFLVSDFLANSTLQGRMGLPETASLIVPMSTPAFGPNRTITVAEGRLGVRLTLGALGSPKSP